MGTIILIVLVILLLGGGGFGYSRYGYGGGIGIGGILLLVLIFISGVWSREVLNRLKMKRPISPARSFQMAAMRFDLIR